MDILMKELIKIGGQFSGVGAFDFALDRLGIEYENVYQAEWDKYARQTYLENHSKPKWYVEDVYDTPINDIPSLDIAMFSPPCQAFSLAGKRKGEDDKRGVLFYNSHEFIQVNKPRYFIFENVKGLLSDAKGRTFQIWLDMLGGKSVNGNPVIFPREDATPYHIYYKVLNAKNYGVPQNRERVFIIGIRDDADNNFHWPKALPLTKRLKDVLETKVDEKFYLSDKMISWITQHREKRESQNDFPMNENGISGCVTARYYKCGAEDPYIKVKSATKKGYEVATKGDSINLSNLNSETRRGRVGKEVAQTLDTACNQAVMMGAIRGRNPEAPKSRVVGLPTEQRLELNMNGTSNALTTVQKDNVVVTKNYIQYDVSGKGYKSQQDRLYYENGIMCTIPAGRTENKVNVLLNDFKIRRLTPRECFRLMDFPDTFEFVCSNSQLYKQAGNSIVVNVLAEIIKKLKL
tara:strand:- start:5204 stop:6589 length:1386 start_codon:yes stop_codon:yes gene_type:complete